VQNWAASSISLATSLPTPRHEVDITFETPRHANTTTQLSRAAYVRGRRQQSPGFISSVGRTCCLTGYTWKAS